MIFDVKTPENCEECVFGEEGGYDCSLLEGEVCRVSEERASFCPFDHEGENITAKGISVINALGEMKKTNISENLIFSNQGWQCPVCGAVYSPWMSQCVNCTGNKIANKVDTKIDIIQKGIEQRLEKLMKGVKEDEIGNA